MSRPMLAKLTGNVGWLLFERAFLLGTGFLVNVWFLKYLGPETFGTYTYAVSLATLFGSVAGLGTDIIVVRDLSRSPEQEGAILGSAACLRLVAAIISWLTAVVVVWFVRDDALSRALVAIVSANAVCTSLGVFELWFQAKIAARPVVIARSLVALASQLARLSMILLGARLTSFAWIYTATGLAMTVVTYLLFSRLGGAGVRLRFELNRASQLMRDSWPIGVAGIAVTVYVKIDQVMLGQMTSAHETGLYAAAATLSELWYFVPTAISTTVFPLIVDATTDGGGRRARRMQQVYDVMAVVSIAIACAVALVAGPLVTALYGVAYAPAARMLVVHAWSLPFVALGTARSRFLVAENMNVFAMLAAILGGVSNIALNYWLIPLYGGLGSSWATLVSYALAGYGSSALSRATWPQLAMQSRALLAFLRPSTISRLRAGR